MSTGKVDSRYTVYRAQWSHATGEVKKVLHTGKTLAEARQLQAEAEAALRQEVGYRPGCMSSPGIGIKLEVAP